MDHDEFTRLFQLLHQPLVAYARIRLRDVEDAHEAVSDAFHTLWTKNVPAPRDDVEHRRLVAFLYRLADGHIRNTARSRGSRDRLARKLQTTVGVFAETTPDPADEVIAARSELLALLARLPTSDQQVLSLMVEGYKTGEIAAILGMSASAASMRLNRAKKRVARVIEGRDRDVREG